VQLSLGVPPKYDIRCGQPFTDLMKVYHMSHHKLGFPANLFWGLGWARGGGMRIPICDRTNSKASPTKKRLLAVHVISMHKPAAVYQPSVAASHGDSVTW